MKYKHKYCKNCKKYNPIEEETFLKNINPRNCILYQNKLCKKFKKLDKFLKYYFPIENLNPHLYEDLNDLHEIENKVYIYENEEFCYYSIKIHTCGKENLQKSKEVWRCKSKEEAIELCKVLNRWDYYWIPITSEGAVFYEKIIL
jgi:hypothetical protein